MNDDESAHGGSEPVVDETAPTLEARLARLEQILAALEADDLELERALELFEEGVGHVRAAEAILAETELRVEELLGPNGETSPLAESVE